MSSEIIAISPAKPRRSSMSTAAKPAAPPPMTMNTRSYRAPLCRLNASLPPDLAAVKQAIELVRQRKPRAATALATSTGDQLMQKLVEWALLRQPESEVGFERYAVFISANPDWPGIPLLRRRAEVKLPQEQMA
jgi:soluble lytic murein transglycosylase